MFVASLQKARVPQGARRFVSTCVALWLLTIGIAGAQTLPSGFSFAQFGSNIGAPTAMEFAPDGRLFVCRQNGQLRIIKNAALLATPFVTLPVDPDGERGLLGVAFDPEFDSPDHKFVYVYYTTNGTPRFNRVSRFPAGGDTATLASEEILVNLDNLSGATNHNGGAIHFGIDGKLYIAVGDNANSANAQTLANRHGKMLRINKDGSIPTDNPFFNTAAGENRAIWALGLRNPFTFAVQPETGRIHINDVGQVSWEEINLGLSGANYGWPDTEGFFNSASFPNFTNPLHAYSHSGSPGGCAIAGGTFYNPSVQRFPNTYLGKYFYGELCNGYVRYIDPDSPMVSQPFATGFSNPVDLKTGPDGALYVLQRGGSGRVYRIAYATQVSGQVTLEDCPVVSGPVTFTFRPTNGSSFSVTPTLTSSGIFTIPNIPVDTYQVAVKGNRWLQKVISVDTRNGNVSGLLIGPLKGGDGNNDNIVDQGDLHLLIQSFDATPADSNWNGGAADFNCDDLISVTDLDIFIRNFDLEGDA